MFGFLVALMILVGLLTIVVILLQAGKGGGLAAVGGGAAAAEGLIGGRQAATILTKATWIGGGVFLGLALILSVMSSRSRAPESILQQEFRQAAPVAPSPVLPGVQTPQAPTGTPDGAGAPAGSEPQSQPSPAPEAGAPEPEAQP